MPAINIPQPVMPLKLNVLTGQFAVCEQGSPQDIASCVLNIISCPIGANSYDPTFGVPQYLFNTLSTTGLDLSALVDAVARQEPRLSALDSEQATDLVQNAVNVLLTGII